MICRQSIPRFAGRAALILIGLSLTGMLASASPAQELNPPPGLNVLDRFGSFGIGGTGGNGSELTLSAQYTLEEGKREGRLTVRAEITEGWHVYSLSQRPGGPTKSQLTVSPAEAIELTGPFSPDKPPKVKEYDVWPGLLIEEHGGELEWTAPFRLGPGVGADAELKELDISVKFSGQVCAEDGVCIPLKRELEIAFGGYYKQAASSEYRPKATHLTLTGFAEPAIARPGQTIRLRLKAVPDAGGWHVYAYEPTDPKKLTKPTLIVVEPPPGWSTSAVSASAEPHEEETGISQQPIQRYHEEPIVWTVDVAIPRQATAGQFSLQGAIAFQTCTKATCDLPSGAKFSAQVQVAAASSKESAPLAFAVGNYADIAKIAEQQASPENSLAGGGTPGSVLDLDALETTTDTKDRATPLVLLIAFAAGFVLNFMPCVLPVIGLKVMSFVQQSGDSRGRIFLLNLWYCAGLMSVFMVLATLVVFMGLGWGEQFSSATFNVVLAAVVFAFALSFLGVWDVPIPGFVGTGKVNDLSTKEGASGAFFKGVLSTVLATPCSGPMLGPALTWAVSQSPAITYAGFACVGLGMASPFLAIGIFPKLVSFLPKPGAWMETFKHIMGFVLLGTVVFLLTFMSSPLVVPMVTFMMGLWAALWWVGRISISASLQTKLRGWLGAAAFATAIGLFAFTSLAAIMRSRFDSAVDRTISERGGEEAPPSVAPGGTELPWQPYSSSALQRLTAEGNTVFVDFTADW
jgi:suppressor for copper-sensitivity B